MKLVNLNLIKRNKNTNAKKKKLLPGEAGEIEFRINFDKKRNFRNLLLAFIFVVLGFIAANKGVNTHNLQYWLVGMIDIIISIVMLVYYIFQIFHKNKLFMEVRKNDIKYKDNNIKYNDIENIRSTFGIGFYTIYIYTKDGKAIKCNTKNMISTEYIMKSLIPLLSKRITLNKN
ncbi:MULTISPECIES: hypothetical protein [Bacillus cereus group]|uniref:Uncharacterized protein n=3 Tax=Bacillus cereus group TaxID=86661 RepID=A0A0J1HX49_BACAN|nr:MULTISPECIES: hypothetical protein [Bacillus cereus group]EOQ19640.1 hypothetical protein IKC_04114 [Bacillus cereus VD184]KLV18311.1 hypothetical protein ABW01_13090 [Bacillus anthracis]OUB77007.1 hypothetical protein BK750_03810 [Bacillus thuringiensis serovar jegathesan]